MEVGALVQAMADELSPVAVEQGMDAGLSQLHAATEARNERERWGACVLLAACHVYRARAGAEPSMLAGPLMLLVAREGAAAEALARSYLDAPELTDVLSAAMRRELERLVAVAARKLRLPWEVPPATAGAGGCACVRPRTPG